MNNEETLALLVQGREVWNRWADAVTAERIALQEAGEWNSDLRESDWNDATRNWHIAAAANFAMHEFDVDVSFVGFSFPGNANFDEVKFLQNAEFSGLIFSGDTSFEGASFFGEAQFSKTVFSADAEFGAALFKSIARFHRAEFLSRAWFESAKFCHIAWFDNTEFSNDVAFGSAVFLGDARFIEVLFSGYAGFNEAEFSNDARFTETVFCGEASFIQCKFLGFAIFDGAKFEKDAIFHTARGSNAFSLSRVIFNRVPDFCETHFDEAPRFDHLDLSPERFARLRRNNIELSVRDSENLPARWRALKRLAVQGYDHMSELAFFKGEVTAKRLVEHKPWQAEYLFGLFYEVLSDFGRSILRPLFALAVCVLGFACFYAGQSPKLLAQPFAGFVLGKERIVAFVTGDATTPTACEAGPDDPWSAALGLSLRNTVPFAGIGSSDKLKQVYACLYGIHTDEALTPGRLPKSFTPKIPDAVAFVSVLQIVVSTVLLFLLLLAVRNHFRIK